MYSKILALGLSGVLMIGVCSAPIKTHSADISESYVEDVIDETVGLVNRYYLHVSSGNDSINLSGYTRSDNIMQSIGIKNIKIQRSSNNTSWTTESVLSDQLNYNSRSFNLDSYSISVTGGYYYRISCLHYANDGSGATQSVSNTSNSVWIS